SASSAEPHWLIGKVAFVLWVSGLIWNRFLLSLLLPAFCFRRCRRRVHLLLTLLSPERAPVMILDGEPLLLATSIATVSKTSSLARHHTMASRVCRTRLSFLRTVYRRH